MAFLRKRMLLDMLREAAMPVGSFMWWFGLESKIPEGWLKLDGSSFDATEYPELYNILGSTTLPNMIDKFIKGGNTGGVSQSAGLPKPSVSASLYNMSFTGTAKNISLSGSVATSNGSTSLTTSEDGDHTHSGIVGNTGVEGGQGSVQVVRGHQSIGTAGKHSHTVNLGALTASVSGSYTPSGSVSGSVSASVTSTSIYGNSTTVTPANVSAIPIIKAGERVGFYSDEQIDGLFDSVESQIRTLEQRVPVIENTRLNHVDDPNAHAELISPKVDISDVDNLESDIDDLEQAIEVKENEDPYAEQTTP